MIMDSHLQNPRESHNDEITIGVHDEEFEKEMVDLKARFDVLMELLQNQKHGCIMKNIVRRPIKQLIARRQKHKLKILLREAEKL